MAIEVDVVQAPIAADVPGVEEYRSKMSPNGSPQPRVSSISTADGQFRRDELIAVLDHFPTRYCVSAERAMNLQFGGNCQIPVAAHATLQQDQLQMHAMI